MEYINEVKLNCQTRIQILARINTNLPFTVEIFEPRDSLLQDIIDSLFQDIIDSLFQDIIVSLFQDIIDSLFQDIIDSLSDSSDISAAEMSSTWNNLK